MKNTRHYHLEHSPRSAAPNPTHGAPLSIRATPPVATTLWRSAVALVDHPSEAPPQ